MLRVVTSSPLRARRGLLVAVALAAFGGALPSACGRTPEPAYPCPFLPEDCASLLAVQEFIENDFRAAVDDGDAARRDEIGQCSQLFSDASVDGGCVERCDELCRLHPCPAPGADAPDEGACVAGCIGLLRDQAVDDTALDAAIFGAAEAPGLCTCRGCASPDDATNDPADDPLCTELFDCAG